MVKGLYIFMKVIKVFLRADPSQQKWLNNFYWNHHKHILLKPNSLKNVLLWFLIQGNYNVCYSDISKSISAYEYTSAYKLFINILPQLRANMFLQSHEKLCIYSGKLVNNVKNLTSGCAQN